MAYNNLRVSLSMQGKLEEAERLLLQAIDGMRRKVGHLHPRTLQMEHELAHRLIMDGRTEEALESFRSSYEGTRSAFGEDGMRTVKTPVVTV